MRRGLMHWSHDEMPEAVLADRVRRLQTAMQAQGLAATLAYTSFARPAVVHWLSNFTPYWSEALLAVPATGDPVLLAALTPRVHEWIRSVARIGSVVSSPRLGTGAVDWLAVHAAVPQRIGVIGLDALPWHVAQPLLQSRGNDGVVDAMPLYHALRQPPDPHERALAHHAARLGEEALATLPHGLSDSSALAAHLEARVRQAGAEELLIRVAPDLRQAAEGLRLEGTLPLAGTYAVELSIAYKGTWVRMGRSLSRGAAPSSWQQAHHWFERACTAMRTGAALPACNVGTLRRWTLDASFDAYPMSPVAHGPAGRSIPLPAGSLASFSAWLDLSEGTWFGSTPLLLASDGAGATGQPPFPISTHHQETHP